MNNSAPIIPPAETMPALSASVSLSERAAAPADAAPPSALDRWLFGGGWRSALVWGVGAALVHRLLLGVWLAGIWTVVQPYLPPNLANINFHDPGQHLPVLTTQPEQLTYAVWRRWDAVHYLNLAAYGYRTEYEGATVFGVLAPFGFRLFDLVLPGGVDAGALAFQTTAFALALVLLYRVVEVCYGDPTLAPWAVAALALTPLSFLFASPLSETSYLAGVLGLFYCGARRWWWRAALCGFVATLSRSQGVLLVAVGAALVVEAHAHLPTWSARLRAVVRAGYPFLIIPAAALLFTLYRALLGLPPVNAIYAEYSYVFFVTPPEGLWINLRWLVTQFPASLLTLDGAVFVVTFALFALMLALPQHRRPALVAYTLLSLLVFVTKINWAWGTDTVTATQSFARYTVVLFPFAVMLGAGLRGTSFWGRIGGVLVLLFALLALSALNVFALLGP